MFYTHSVWSHVHGSIYGVFAVVSLETSLRPFRTFMIEFFFGIYRVLYPLSVNPAKWSNTLKQIVGNSRRIV